MAQGNVVRLDSDAREMWRQRVRDARNRYQCASAQFHRILMDEQRFPAPHPDGAHAIHVARVTESETFAEYMRVLKRFSQFSMGRTAE